MKYILVGIPSVGKTTIGRQAAQIVKLPFYDIDEIAREGIQIDRPSAIIDPALARYMIAKQRKTFLDLTDL